MSFLGVACPARVYHAAGAARFRNSGFLHTLADGGHRFEIVRLIASLNLIELIPRIMPGTPREAA
jgi:hypothetical protein